MSGEEVAKAFVQHFYQTFDNNADGLAGLYLSSDFSATFVSFFVRSIGVVLRCFLHTIVCLLPITRWYFVVFRIVAIFNGHEHELRPFFSVSQFRFFASTLLHSL